MEQSLLSNCQLCPRKCGVNRLEGEKGYCGMGSDIMAARAAIHRGEEPFLAGEGGSGAVFFSGCSLKCIYCQNREIALLGKGKTITAQHLSEIFTDLQEKGADNIDLVTGAHFAPIIRKALLLAKKNGLKLPVIYNSSGYEEVQTLKMLEDVVDIYVPDVKYAGSLLAKELSGAPDYPEKTLLAVKEMVRQKGMPSFGADGLMKRGTLFRLMVLPGHTKDAMQVIDLLTETFGKDVYLSLMSQYTPVKKFTEMPELNRRLTKREYEKVLDYAIRRGIENGFMQKTTSSGKEKIPSFNGEGLE